MKLKDKAILTHCRICLWTGSKASQKESRELCNKKGAAIDAATVIVNYVPKETLKDLRTKAGRIRSTFFRWTRPYLDGGVRILALANMKKHDDAMKEAIDDYNECANKWVKNEYPKIIANMPKRLADLLDNKRMPTPIELLSKFRIEHSKFPVPDVDDFVGDAELKAEVKRSIKEATQKSMVDIWGELSELIGKVQERLSDPDKKFKDSLIKNLTSFCERISNENFTEDEQLDNIRQTVMKKLANIDPQDLRENKLYRKGASLKAGEILKSIRKIDLDME
jgi:hypothetical protein